MNAPVLQRRALSLAPRLEMSCPCCGMRGEDIFYAVDGAPVHDVRLTFDRSEALTMPTGAIRLVTCARCGFIWNAAFDIGLLDYGVAYESTQAFSPTFTKFHRNLAEELVARYQLFGKTVLEIGCGQGEFLSLLCEIGNNKGVGVDPAYVGPLEHGNLRFVRELYSERSAAPADFICCKMTLEHIPDAGEFVRTVRRAAGDDRGRVIFFQIPDVKRILAERGFWDVYYEHCSYFSAGSLARLFRASGFEVMDLWRGYDDQYLMVEARPGSGAGAAPLMIEETPEELAAAVAVFAARVRHDQECWRGWLKRAHAAGRRVVLWGGGSKAVAFLTTLGIREEIRYAVDVNPRKAGSFTAGTGQEVVMPEFLRGYRPDAVVVMNPIYFGEIRQKLSKLGLDPAVLRVDAPDRLPNL